MRSILGWLIIGAFGAIPTGLLAAGSLEGKWALVSVLSGAESIQAIVQIETRDGKTEPKVIFSPQNSKAEISDFRVTEKGVSFRFRQTLQVGPRAMSSEVEFVGVRGNDPKVILGSTGPVGGDDRARGRAGASRARRRFRGRRSGRG